MSDGEATREPKYPEIEAQLTGEDGNAFFIIGRVAQKMRGGGVPKDEVEEFTSEAMAGDYSHVLRICAKWVTVL